MADGGWAVPRLYGMAPSAVIGSFFGQVCVKMGIASLLTKEVLPWPELVDILVDAVLGMLEQVCRGT